MGIKDKEKNLFEEWKEKQPNIEIDGFITDGIINETKYNSCKRKILFVLKEVNTEGEGDLLGFLREGSVGTTWNNITRWTKGIRGLPRVC